MSDGARRERKNHQDLVTAYGLAAVTAVLDEARERGERDHVGYANEVLAERYAARGTGGAPKQDAIPERLICDLHARPCWTNDMVVRNGRAVCSVCAESREIPPPAGVPFVTRIVVGDTALDAIPTQWRRRVVRIADDRETAWQRAYEDGYDEYLREREQELMTRFPEQWKEMQRLLREQGLLPAFAYLTRFLREDVNRREPKPSADEIAGFAPGATAEARHTARLAARRRRQQREPLLETDRRWAERQREMGLRPVIPPDERRYTVDVYDDPALHMTPAARLVAAYWARVGS